MVQIDISYAGELRCAAAHEPSSASLETDAPVDNQGRGESFSPTDLLATSLGTCMLTIMGIAARRDGIDLEGARVRVVKHMLADPARRVAKLEVQFALPGALSSESQAALERAALGCPVRHSIDPRIDVPVHFGWGELGRGELG